MQRGVLIWTVGGAVTALLLSNCAGNPFGETTGGAQNPDMPGRWVLVAPNAPPCGMEFKGAPGAKQGIVSPDGGCPGKFFTSRHWTFGQGALTINDQDNQTLARLNFANGSFEGQASAGVQVTLSRAE